MMAFRRTPYNAQTVSPPTIVRTARPFSFQPSKGCVARQRLELGRVDRPFQIGIDQGDVRFCANRQRAGIKLQQFRGLDREHFDQPVDGNRFPFVQQNIDEQSELRLEADNSERRLIELDFLFKGGVRRMIAAKNRQGPVGDSLNNRINIALRTQRRVHFAVGVKILNRRIGQRDVMRANFAARFSLPGHALRELTGHFPPC